MVGTCGNQHRSIEILALSFLIISIFSPWNNNAGTDPLRQQQEISSKTYPLKLAEILLIYLKSHCLNKDVSSSSTSQQCRFFSSQYSTSIQSLYVSTLVLSGKLLLRFAIEVSGGNTNTTAPYKHGTLLLPTIFTPYLHQFRKIIDCFPPICAILPSNPQLTLISCVLVYVKQ